MNRTAQVKARLIGAGLMASALLTGCAETQSWSAAMSMPTGRQEIYADSRDGVVYIPGGILKDGVTATSAFESYDIANDRWTELAPLPEERHHITPAIVGDKVYAIGGFIGGFPDWQIRPDVFVYDITTGSWADGVDLPVPVAEHVAVVIGGDIHVIGGRIEHGEETGNFDAYYDTGRHWVFSTDTQSWSEAPAAPTARNSAAAAVIEDRIYVVGGRSNIEQDDGTQLQHNTGALEVFDPATQEWSTLAPLPVAMGGLAAAASDGKLYVFGGEQWTPEQRVFAHAFVYDPAADSWTKLDDLPTARHGLTAAAFDGRIVAIGGCLVVGGGAATNIVEVLASARPVG